MPDIDEICRVYAGSRSAKAINIWCDSVSKLGIYRQKTAMGHFPPPPKFFFRSLLAPKLLVGLKKSRGVPKWYGHSLSSCKVWCRSAATRQHEKQKLGVFVFCFLFVCHALDLEQRFSYSNSDIVAICRSILMRISAFFRGRSALSNV